MRSILVVIIISVVVVFTTKIAFAVDEPPYSIVLKENKIELRQYEPTLVANVVVTGDMRKAGRSGFRLLADYIFGNNKPAEKIAMTAPVTRTENKLKNESASTKIKMTAPVTRVENVDKSWTVTFVMPEKWNIDTLPRPNNEDVRVLEVPGELIATLRFSGRGGESTYRKKQKQLELWIEEQGYEAIAAPRYAGYDAPWVIWPLRRNEVMIPVAKKAKTNKVL